MQFLFVCVCAFFFIKIKSDEISNVEDIIFKVLKMQRFSAVIKDMNLFFLSQLWLK